MTEKRMTVEEIAQKLCRSHNVLLRERFSGMNCDSCNTIREALLSFAAQEAEPLVMAVKFYANKEQYTNMGFNGEPTPIYHDRGAVAKEALTAWEGKK